MTMLSPNFSVDDLDVVRNVEGVAAANFIYGPYDLFIKIHVDSREELRKVVDHIRSISGIKSTITCNVIPD